MVKAIVTGGAIRVGKATCLALAEAGYDIILICNRSEKEAEATAGEINKLGRACEIYKCDLSSKQNIDQIFNKVFLENDIKLVVNNSSIFEKHDFLGTSEDVFDRHFNINLKAPFFISQAYANYCAKGNLSGHIINILDSLITRNTGSHFAYLLTKKSLHDLTLMMARNLGPQIRVNAVSLGFLLPSEDFSEAWMNEKSKKMPLGKKIELEMVTDAIIYLDKSNYLTGENIFIDSGWKLT